MILKIKDFDLQYLFEKSDIIGDIYESFIIDEGKTMKDNGQYFTDRLLIDHSVKLCNPRINNGTIETVYDGASGTGGFLIQAIQHIQKQKEIDWNTNMHNIYATDINKNTVALLKLNMYFTTGKILPNVTMADTLKQIV